MFFRVRFAVEGAAVYPEAMLKWLLTTLLALIVFSAAMPWLARRFGVGNLPGDMRFRVRGREYLLPLASTLLLTFFAWFISRLI
jgi:Protein of unknown function (DUF2905)